jgi:hypothetical protein
VEAFSDTKEAARSLKAVHEAIANAANESERVAQWLVLHGARLEESNPPPAAAAEPVPSFLPFTVAELVTTARELRDISARLQLFTGPPDAGGGLSLERLRLREQPRGS